MNRSEFIKEIMSLYPHTFDVNNEAQYTGWIKRYQQIPESWDFDKLMVIFSRKWNSTKEAPSPSWFMQFREDVKPQVSAEQQAFKLNDEQRKEADEWLKKYKAALYNIAEKHKL